MCDICFSAEETLKLTPPEMRAAVDAGFDPFTSRLVDQVTIDQWSDGVYRELYEAPGPEGSKDFTPAYQAALNKWKRDLVATDTSPWRFCATCAANVRQFTSQGSGVKRSAQELRAEQTVRQLVFGDSAAPPPPKWWQFWKI